MSGLFGHVNQNNSNDEQQDSEQGVVQHSDDSLTDGQSEDITSDSTESSSEQATKFSVGIDLGTTHCVLSYLNLAEDEEQISQQVMPIAQLSSPGVVEDKYQLASFLYIPHAAEMAEGTTALPWSAKPDFLVGDIARNLGSKTPIRLVASAKSWLCHAGVDCKQAILPSEAPEEVDRISPFQATQAYLQHIKDAWENQHPQAPLEQQDLIITVPASFDPAARELTVEAARAVGLNQALLLEEPQSALYSWINNSLGDWRNHVSIGDVILVVDVGGGTTDLSLICVTEQEGNLQLTRVAVGDHILLGGDNMDLALAYTIKAKIEQGGDTRLEPWQIQALSHACRDAKEKVFNNPDCDNVPLVIPSRGSSLIGGSLRSELTREEVDRVLVEGFLPEIAVSEKPVSNPRSGLRTKGLPYAQDAGITRHLAAFLTKQHSAVEEIEHIKLAENATFLHPTAILLNGGVLKADVLAQRLLQVLNNWLTTEQAPVARMLEGADLDLAVAKGAAYFGRVRQGKGVRIKGGTAASYYVGVESSMPAVPGLPAQVEALCIAPFGMEEGTEEALPEDEFGLIIGEPVKFRFFASNIRREDQVGMRLDYWRDEELEELDEIEITLPEEGHSSGEIIPVKLSATVTEVGTLELHAISQQDQHRWKIEFDVRAGDD